MGTISLLRQDAIHLRQQGNVTSAMLISKMTNSMPAAASKGPTLGREKL
jgi:hypothetical protein